MKFQAIRETNNVSHLVVINKKICLWFIEIYIKGVSKKFTLSTTNSGTKGNFFWRRPVYICNTNTMK